MLSVRTPWIQCLGGKVDPFFHSRDSIFTSKYVNTCMLGEVGGKAPVEKRCCSEQRQLLLTAESCGDSGKTPKEKHECIDFRLEGPHAAPLRATS